VRLILQSIVSSKTMLTRSAER